MTVIKIRKYITFLSIYNSPFMQLLIAPLKYAIIVYSKF